MFDRILKQLRKKIRTRQYLMTLHADEEKEEDGLTIFDVEHAILTGDIIERQKEYQTGKWKYLIQGQTFDEKKEMVIATKISPTDQWVIITVYLL